MTIHRLPNEFELSPAAGPSPSNPGPTRRAINRAGSCKLGLYDASPDTTGRRLARRRLELNLTQAEVATRVMIEPKTGVRSGVARPLSRNAYAMYETDAIEPSLTVFNGLAKALGVDPSWLAFGVVEHVSPNPDAKLDAPSDEKEPEPESVTGQDVSQSPSP